MTDYPLVPLTAYTRQAVSLLADCQELAELLTIGFMSNGEMPSLIGTHIWGYNPLAAGEMPDVQAIITVETELVSHTTPTMDEWRLNVCTYVRRTAMELETNSYPEGINRREAIVQAADKQLAGSRLFGTSPLEAIDCHTLQTPSGILGRQTVYRTFHRVHPQKRP